MIEKSIKIAAIVNREITRQTVQETAALTSKDVGFDAEASYLIPKYERKHGMRRETEKTRSESFVEAPKPFGFEYLEGTVEETRVDSLHGSSV